MPRYLLHWPLKILSQRTIGCFYQRFGISSDFLDSDPQTWELRDDYKAALETVSQLKVVNDSAERGVALIEEYTSIITRKENQKQYFLQVVQDHRRKFSDCKKDLLMKLKFQTKINSCHSCNKKFI